MKYRFNNNLLVINESFIYARKHIQKCDINNHELNIRNGNWHDRFDLPSGGVEDHKFIAKLKQDIEAWLNNEA